MQRVSDRTWNTAVGYLAAVVFAGIAGFALGATFSTGCPLDPQNAPFGCAEFLLSRYQTMIAAVIAAIAVFPVWRQVRLQGMQTDILKGEALRQRVSTLGRMRNALVTRAKVVREELQLYPERVDNVSFWAHDASQQIDGFLDFVSGQKSLRLDGEQVAAARADLISKLTILSRAFWVMNWDVYLDDEDTPSDEEAAALRDEATEAEARLGATISAALASIGALQLAILEDIGVARTKLHALGENLVSQSE
ncbi:hypothetical protein [Bradyrhizobium sp. ERR14]|uniref:hypothetical protein n=1 Tax=Bradyrhizobium sp. ERR14 TaxID=2663837 RepID=UPI0016092E6E|nr:hypothetical protein [Bradyrhizobium sp. ERR14]MBB4391666.1 hypothetical protein [Bradyrhizobium sp. ERR14]